MPNLNTLARLATALATAVQDALDHGLTHDEIKAFLTHVLEQLEQE